MYDRKKRREGTHVGRKVMCAHRFHYISAIFSGPADTYRRKDGRVSNPGEGKRFPFLQNSPNQFAGPPVLLYNRCAGFLPRQKRTEREGDVSPPCSVKVKNDWNYTSTPPLRLRSVEGDNCNFFHL